MGDRISPKAIRIIPTIGQPSYVPTMYWVVIGYFPYYLYKELFGNLKEAKRKQKQLKEAIKN